MAIMKIGFYHGMTGDTKEMARPGADETGNPTRPRIGENPQESCADKWEIRQEIYRAEREEPRMTGRSGKRGAV